MSRPRLLLAAAVAGLALAAPPAAPAAPVDDYNAVYADWQPDGRITPCRFQQAQLESARTVAESNLDDYYTDLGAQIDREIARWRSGGCAGRTPASVLDRSPLAGVRIARVSHRGGAARELLRLRNTTRSTVDLRGATIRNRRGTRVRLPRGVRLRRGQSVTVRIGCARGKRRASVRGGTAYACRRRALFADGGDAARLADRSGVVVSQRGFGRYRGLVSF